MNGRASTVWRLGVGNDAGDFGGGLAGAVRDADRSELEPQVQRKRLAACTRQRFGYFRAIYVILSATGAAQSGFKRLAT